MTSHANRARWTVRQGHLVVRDRVAEAKLQQGANALGQPVGGGFLLLEHRHHRGCGSCEPQAVAVPDEEIAQMGGEPGSVDGIGFESGHRGTAGRRPAGSGRSGRTSPPCRPPVQAWNRCMARAEASPAGSGGSRRSRRRSVTSVSRSGGISASTCATVAAFPTGTKRLTTLSASAGSPGGRGSPDRVRSAPSPARVRLGRARRRC